MRRCVIVGAGHGGVHAAIALRQKQYDGEIVLVSGEALPPYQRPPLSKAFLSGKVTGEDLLFRPERFYGDHRIDLRLGQRVNRIDRVAKFVEVATGDSIEYDKLVLAVGAENRRLGGDHGDVTGLYELRTLNDARALKEGLRHARRVVVVGGGFIGLEFAALAASFGVDVTVVEAADRVMARAVSRDISNYFERFHSALGVKFCFETMVQRVIVKDRCVIGIETSSYGDIEADLIVVGIGVVPNTDLAANAGLPTANGVLVDRFLKTVDESIFAIGDCTAHPSNFAAGVVTRIESVQNAADQAKCVASQITGQKTPYDAVPWFWSDQGGELLQTVGLPTNSDMCVIRGDVNSRQFSVFRYLDDQLRSVESVNQPAEHMIARSLIKAGVKVPPANAADTSWKLGSHLK